VTLRGRAITTRLAQGLPTFESAALTAAYTGGLAAIAAGTALVYVPAGVIVGGLLAAGSAVMYARNGGRS
jgi:hypothetical protein